MGKRGNDNAQLSKEEYDALESRGGGSSSSQDGGSGGFARASAEEMAKRRIVRSRRTLKKSPAPTGTTDSDSNGKGGGGGIFASVKLGNSNSSTVESPGKPQFALPSSAPAAQPKSNPFGSINLTTASAPKSTLSTSAAASAPSPSTKKQGTSKAETFTQSFMEYVANAPASEDLMGAAEHFLNTMAAMQKPKNSSSNGKENRTNVTSKNTTRTIASKIGTPLSTMTQTPAASSSTSLFTTSPADAPVPFSFANTTSQNSSSVKQPTFSFGSAASPVPAPAPVSTPADATGKGSSTSSGFNFSPAPVAAAPAFGTNIKIAMTPVPASSENIDGNGESAETTQAEETTELASADTDWNEISNVQAFFYHYRDKGGKAKKFASGNLKIQQEKSNLSKHRMVLRDAAGKVLVNIGINKSMAFTKSIPATKPGKTPKGQIMFMGINDVDKGAEKFSIVMTATDIDTFHAKLEELSS